MPGVMETPDATWSTEVEDYPRQVAWTPDGRALIVAGGSGRVVWLRSEDGSIAFQADAHRGGVVDMAVHPGDGRLATSGEDGAVRVWDVKGQPAATLIPASDVWAGPLAWSPDGRHLAASRGKTMTVFVEGKAPLTEVTYPESTIAALGWSPDGATLAAAGYGGVKLVDPATGTCKQTLAWKGSMLSLTYSPGGKVVACGCQDNSLHFWRLPAGKDSQMSGYPSKPVALSWSHDGKQLASAGGSVATLWPFDGRGPEGRRPLELDGHDDTLTALTFAPLVKVLATGCKQGRVCLWLPQEMKRPARTYQLPGKIESLAWGLLPQRQSMMLAGADAGGVVRVWPFA